MVDESPPDSSRRSTPKLSRGKQKSYKLTGRIEAYVTSRSVRHGVSQAEVVRSMLNERIDHDEMLERSTAKAIADDQFDNK